MSSLNNLAPPQHDFNNEYEEMEVINSQNDINCGSINMSQTDEEIKSNHDDESENDDDDDSMDDSMDDDDITDSLTSIEYFSSGLDGKDNNNNYGNHNPIVWCQIINFLVQIHYDMGHPALKPNIISLCGEYLAYLANNGHFNNLLLKNKKNNNDYIDDIDIRQNILIRMALFEAVKYDQGFQMNISKLFDLNYYPKTMVFSQSKEMFMKLKNNDFNNNIYNKNNNKNKNKKKNNNELIDWLRIHEIEFCNKLNWKFSFSTRYQTLMIYLKRLGFDTNCVISQQYKNVKLKFAQIKQEKQMIDNNDNNIFSDKIKFCFLCRYLLEMTYYKPEFYSFSKNDLIISIIYSSFIIAQRWNDKFINFLNIFNFDIINNKNKLFIILDNKNPKNNLIIYNLIKKIIRLGRSPHSCFNYCSPIYFTNPLTNNTTHYHSCKCIFNCCLNTYLKYSKMAFCQISKMPCLSTSNLNKFCDWIDNNNNNNKQQLQQQVQQPITSSTNRIFINQISK